MTDLDRAVEEQRQWIAEHGGDEAGYVERYGSASDPHRYGDGGEAIYAADLAYLTRLMDRMIRLHRKHDERRKERQ